jgi:hypothetical protein
MVEAVDARLRHWSRISSRTLPSSLGTHCVARSTGGPAGMPSKYFLTSVSARSGVMSPASDSTQLLGP